MWAGWPQTPTYAGLGRCDPHRGAWSQQSGIPQGPPGPTPTHSPSNEHHAPRGAIHTDTRNDMATKRSRSSATKSRTKKTTKAPVPSTDVFQTADDQAHMPRTPNIKRGFHEVVRKLFDGPLDVQREFDIIEASLSITGPLTPQAITRSANQSEDMARRAYHLFIAAKVEYEAYMRETEIITAAIRDAATAKLEREKASGVRTKQITDADVLAYMASDYPDQWNEVELRRSQAKGMLKYIENLSSLAKTRCFTLARMLAPTGDMQ